VFVAATAHVAAAGEVNMRCTAIICGLSIGFCFVQSVGCGSDSGGSAGAGGGAGAGAGTFVGAGTGGGAGFVGSTGGGGASVTDGGFVDPDAACAAQRQDSRPMPTDIFIMLDKSISMNCPAADAACTQSNTPTPPTRWTAVIDAITAFAAAPANVGIGIGLGIFPSLTCDPQVFASGATPIAPLPAGGTAVLNRIAATIPGGTTPTVPALQGAILYAKQYMQQNPGKTAAVVFVTDGMPNDVCTPPSSVQLAADAAKAGFDGTPSIETYVVGLGATAALDQIALAGSGGATHYFDANGADAATKLRDILKLVSQPITCDYPIPTTTTALNYDAVDVQTRLSDTAPTINLKYVTSASACSSTPAWYYDRPPPGIPTKITLCPSACDPLKGVDTASVQAVIGCAPRIY
jgi:hypothetical protein